MDLLLDSAESGLEREQSLVANNLLLPEFPDHCSERFALLYPNFRRALAPLRNRGDVREQKTGEQKRGNGNDNKRGDYAFHDEPPELERWGSIHRWIPSAT